MKQIILLFILSLGLMTQAQAQKKNKERDQISTMVEGLGCPYCAYGLEKKFKKLKGIKKIKIDIEEGLFSFTLPSEYSMTLEEIDNRIADAGYTPMTIKIDRSNGEVLESNFEAQDVESDMTSEFTVFGICNMCKSRIERRTQKVIGVASAKWDKKTKILKVSYDTKQTTVKEIKQVLADAGHDTEDIKADLAAYDNLPACCLYDRNDLKQKSH